MDRAALISTINLTQLFFDTSTAKLDEEDSGYAPAEGMMTVAQQVAHVARTADWFLEGAFLVDGMDLDFAQHLEEVKAVESLQAAREWLTRSFDAIVKKLEEASPEMWGEMITGEIMNGSPRSAVVNGIAEHTSHHRGALSVYQRLLGREPTMPYA